MLQDKLHQEKEAGKHKKKKELQLESNRLGDLRREIEMAKKELELDMETRKDKERKSEMGKMNGQEPSRLRERRRTIAKDISTKNEETSRSKARPPPAPKTKEPPTNLLDLPKKSPIKSAQLSQDDERRCRSGEEEEEKDREKSNQFR